jgi:molybdenum cofactor cytidylyltransferase
LRVACCIVLAAGRSERFGSNKLLRRADHEPLLERAVRACGGFERVIVASPENAAFLSGRTLRVVVNDRPELGMTHSLKLANQGIDSSLAIVVFPADLALIEPQNVAYVVGAAADADVTYPRRGDGVPGHPVVFSPRARGGIADLPDGDTIRQLRDRADLSRRILILDERWPYVDVDYPSDEELIRSDR